MPAFVALTTGLDPAGGGHEKPQVVLYDGYIRVLTRVGLTPVLVTPAHDPEHVTALVAACAGLVLSGGEDVDPGRYGEAPIPELEEVSAERDAMEWGALDAATAVGCPVLGICRGMQVLNVYFGGSLYQDLPSQLGGGDHNQSAPWGEHHHEVRCVEGSRLHAALGDLEPIRVNSYHHQGVKELAPGLVATAHADDGLVEGVESADHEWVVGVQWHPERQEAEAGPGDPDTRILAAFADAVRQWSGGE